jgi:inosine-uridine nucleoside N-ribohydrolase
MKRIILDTDFGPDVDDAPALALAAASPELQIEGVTTVHGDAPCGRVSRVCCSPSPDVPRSR